MSLLNFDDILTSSYFDFKSLMQDIDKYLAHLSKNNSKHEDFLTHSNLVLQYAMQLIENNKLEKSINKIIQLININIKIQNDIKFFYLKAIYWHDIGKINENFQKEKMQNYFENIDNGISSKHSILSTYLYLLSCFQYINKEYQDINERIELISVCTYFSLTLWRHHTGLSASWKEFLIGDEGVKIFTNLYIYVSKLKLEIDESMHNILLNNLKNINFTKNENYYILSKSLFSLLIISDYYATAQFMNYGNCKELKYNDFGLIDNSFRDRIYKKFYENQFDKKLINKSNEDFKEFNELENKSNDNLNNLRNKLFVEVRTNLQLELEKNKSQNLFYIEAPTGAGKTNLSMMSMVEILKYDASINKVFYVFPFTTLITQTYESLKKTLALNNSQIVQLHSKAKYNQKKEESEDGVYGDDKKNFLDNQFMNYPITLLSHVKFFDILTGISKDDNYIFHRLVNSVVIIDEIQTYSPNLWSQIVYLLDMFAKNFNIKFIVMSATLPKIGEIIDSDFIFLVSNKQQYFQNPNFAKRVAINTDVIQIQKPEDIYLKLEEESKIYQNLKTNESKKVKTIIEFITKKGADEFYKYAKKHNKIFDEILILSGTILEPRRKEIISFIKNTHNKNILLVTTQVVEAGVDIDMDIGFKEKSLLDSDEQLAGRINRNSFKQGNKLFLFKIGQGNENFVYRDDKRKNISAIYQEDGEVKNVLDTKNFDKFYTQIINQIIEKNKKEFIKGLNDYKNNIKNLRFSDVHIKIIDMQSVSVFIPINDEAVSIWEKHESAIQNKEQDLIDKKISLKELASKISQYTFSLADYPKSGIEYLEDYGEIKYGYLYLRDWEAESDGKKLYSYKDGLETSILKGEFVSMII